MKGKWGNLRLLLPVGGLALILVLNGVNLFFAYLNQREEQVQRALRDLRREVAGLARLAETVMAAEPRLVEDELAHLGIDPRLEGAAIISPDGIVVYASDFSWRGEPAVANLRGYAAATAAQVQKVRTASIVFAEGERRLVALMSFTAPARANTLRGLERGLTYLAFDLSKVEGEAFRAAARLFIQESLAVLVVGLLGTWILFRQVLRPLAELERAAESLAKGQLVKQLAPQGPNEIRALTHSFNHMSAELARVMAELDQQSRHTQAVIDNVVDGIVTIDANGIILSFSQSATRIFGYEAAEVRGRNVSLLMPEPMASQHDGYLARYRETREARVIGIGRELVGRRRDGTEFPVELAVSEIVRQGEPLYVGIIRDITERKRVEQMKREFISTVSHELRTPLTALLTAVRMLASGALGPLPPAAKRYIEVARGNGSRLATLINDLLDLEKFEAGKLAFELRAQELLPLVAQAVQGIHVLAEQRRVTVVLREESEHLQSCIDANRLLQVLTNLISNAIKFSRDGSRVEVRMKRSEGWARIEVTDEGAGIPESFRSRIFEKFSQADASDSRGRGGTGLGLAISKVCVEGMGGQIGFQSVVGAGTTFHCSFPLITSSAPKVEAGPPAAPAPGSPAAPDRGTERSGALAASESADQ